MNENLLQLGFLALVVVGFILLRLMRYAPDWEHSWSGVGRNSAFWLGSVVGGLAVAAVMFGAFAGPGASAAGGGRGVEAANIPAGPGRDLFSSKTCNNCHTVAGISTGTVGPELTHVGGHAQIAGTLPMSKENLVKWIKDPPGQKPGTTMPNLGISDADASALADWLLQLK
jgi:cytochrome c1